MLRMLKGGAVAMALVAAPALAGNQAQPGSTATNQSQVKQLEELTREVQRAWNDQDAQKVASHYAPGAVIAIPGQVAEGRRQIQQLVQQQMNQLGQGRVKLTLDSVQWLPNGLALLDITEQTSGTAGTAPQTMHSAVVVGKQGGQWQALALRGTSPGGQQGVGGAGMCPDESGEPEERLDHHGLDQSGELTPQQVTPEVPGQSQE